MTTSTLATGRSIHSALRTRNSTLLRPSAIARSRAPESIASARSETITPPIGATSSAANMAVSPRPAASSSTRSPGCGPIASIIQCETGALNSRIARCWRVQPDAASSQFCKLASRWALGSKLISSLLCTDEELFTQELSRSSTWQWLVGERHLLGHLMCGEATSAMGAQRLHLQHRAWPRHHDRRDGLAPALVCAAEDGRLK